MLKERLCSERVANKTEFEVWRESHVVCEVGPVTNPGSACPLGSVSPNIVYSLTSPEGSCNANKLRVGEKEEDGLERPPKVVLGTASFMRLSTIERRDRSP